MKGIYEFKPIGSYWHCALAATLGIILLMFASVGLVTAAVRANYELVLPSLEVLAASLFSLTFSVVFFLERRREKRDLPKRQKEYEEWVVAYWKQLSS